MKLLEPRPFRREVEELLAMTGETLDDELLAATRELRDAAAQHDEADVRFVTAANEVQRLLISRIG